MYQDMVNPKSVTIIVRNFKWWGRKNSVDGVIKHQFNLLPAVIAPIDRRAVGIVQKISVSLVGCSGREEEGAHITERRKRAVYLAVSPVAKKNISRNIIFVWENKENSRIKSFE